MDPVREFVAGRGELDCNQILSAWNLFGDVARSTGEIGGDFKELDQAHNAVYDKGFYGCNLPSITPEGQRFAPSWSPDELAAIRELMKHGFALFNRVIDASKNEKAEQSGARQPATRSASKQEMTTSTRNHQSKPCSAGIDRLLSRLPMISAGVLGACTRMRSTMAQPPRADQGSPRRSSPLSRRL
jgi:hypothetical protein